jgi:hypothetical protein
MNQDFYAFFKEPDPLYSNSNDFVQHLLSNSAGNVPSLMEESMMEYSNPHVEAGQILQALSASERPVMQNQDIG